MADIFISYSSRHRDYTRALADALVAEGLSVWWDTELEAYATFRNQIDAALSEARVVVVVWSEGAAASDYVIAEAREALTNGRLVNTLAPGFNPLSIPKPFGEYQAEKVERVQAVVRAILRRWRGEKPEKLDAADFYERSTGKSVLSPKRETVSAAAHVTPALLLNARLALAPYLDVHGLRTGLAAWAREGRTLRGRLVHGPGGLGKTRLLAEVCSDLRAQDWAAGFVETPAPDDVQLHRLAIEHLIDTDRHAGLMLVLDYAERRQDEAARYAGLMARAAAKRPDRKLRLVLLARSAGEWWDRTVEDSPDLQAVFSGTDSVVQLAPFQQVDQRERHFMEASAVFRQAIINIRRDDPEAFAGWGNTEASTISAQLRSDLSSDAYARPLMIQIAALLYLQGETPDASSVASLLDSMLGLERRYWRAALGSLHSEPRQTALTRGTIQTTLAGGVARADAESLLLADKYFGRKAPADAAEPLGDLQRLYGNGEDALMSLEPDLVGEHLAATDGDERLVDACLAWAGADQKRGASILTVLNRATREEHGSKAERAKRLLDHIVRAHGANLAEAIVSVALETPGDLAGVVERAAGALDWMTCSTVYEAVPEETLRLAGAAYALAARATDLARQLASSDSGVVRDNLAISLNNLGIRLSQLGRVAEALTATQEAADINRRLAQARPDAFRPDLAMSLNNLGNKLSDLGRLEEALTATQEATDIYRQLAQARPDVFLSDIAMSLSNLGNRLSDLGLREEALTATQEAADIYRQLAQAGPDAFLSDLAMSLSNLGISLSGLGRWEEALAATQEAADTYRQLAQARPDAFLPGLAAALGNLGGRLSSLRRREEALAATQEAVEIRRQLAQARPDAFLPDLAMSLSNLGISLSALGQLEEALTATQEAVEIRRQLAQARPDAPPHDLAMALNNLGGRLSGLGRWEEALAATQEAASIYRQLEQAWPDAFLPDLATALNNLGISLSDLGRWEEALTATQEAVKIRRQLAQARPDAFRPDLASAVNNLGNRLSDLGRWEEALTATQEAVKIRRQLAQARPDAFRPDLARSLSRLGDILTANGQPNEAIEAYLECARLLKPLAENLPGAHRTLFNANNTDLVKAWDAASRSEAELAEVLRSLGVEPPPTK